MVQVHGTCDERFGEVRDALAESLAKDDVGASVAVAFRGELVADLWGGYADAGRTVAWEEDTITNVWSTTKTMIALCALILADRGELDLDAPLVRYWPEFGAADVRVRHVLSHTAGLPVWDTPITLEDIGDPGKVTTLLAAQKPRWTPGEIGCYHALTQGFLLGEIVRRITGKTIGAFFAAEVAGPLGADFHIGLPDRHHHRVAPSLAPPGGLTVPPPTELFDAAPNPEFVPEDTNTAAWRRAEIPSGAGYGNARSVARVQSVLSAGGAVDGVRLLSRAGCERALEEQYHGLDYGFGVPMRYGLGYGISGRNCFWGGMGGSLVFNDLDAGLTVAYAMNQMLDAIVGDGRGMTMVGAAYSGLG
ncbi:MULTISPECIES: serine hydrolase domain-containing protein [unclassified Amycolatopsis]|uniref:serine hydrolase domain-containing protein n=1 Tax=unclassified Amycolatopsis TaxID=2618356 RepID=UPI00287720CA|nr:MULTISPECIES: serine hydrolase domain-containing protein [unclassified Amycolatopsis]MDS0137921.1 beta-lactamase family protein [Amycolatopsis sp. 505]MDS0144166.1 beta-lactamase family protein [Amycolatopsis sp. CM201R]